MKKTDLIKKNAHIVPGLCLWIPNIVLWLLLVYIVPCQADDSGNVRKITVQYEEEQGAHARVFRECVGAGRANEGLRADWQAQLRTVQKEIGFRYIRFHGLLCDDMGVYREDKDGNPRYNWQYIDVLFDSLIGLDLIPFVELGFMPSDLASGEKTIFWWKGNVTPPKSYKKWGDLVRNLVLHWEQRYGREALLEWYFEVWNEPDLPQFFDGTMEEYFQLYDVTAKEIKGICKDYRVGGPASASPYKYETEFVKHCAKNNIPVDFVSTHCYGVQQGFLDEFGHHGTLLDMDPDAVTSRMIHSRELIRRSPLPHLELHFTEWSSSYTPTDPIHDAYHSASFILDKVKGTEAHVNSLSYWVFTDIFEEAGPRWEPFHGGFGMLNYQGIKKPAYYAYYFMNQLGNVELVNTDPSSWACKNQGGGVQILLWDFTPKQAADSVNNQVYFRRDLPPESSSLVEIIVAGLPEKTYFMQIYKIGYRINDAYTTYLDLGCPDQLTREQVRMIQQINDNAPVVSEFIEVPDHCFTKKVTVRENDVLLLMLEKTR